MENIRKRYKKNRLEITALTWNDEFELPDGSYYVLDIQDWKYETLTAVPALHVYINRFNNRLVFEIKNWYKLELQMIGTKKLFHSTKKINWQNKKMEKKYQILK